MEYHILPWISINRVETILILSWQIIFLARFEIPREIAVSYRRIYTKYTKRCRWLIRYETGRRSPLQVTVNTRQVLKFAFNYCSQFEYLI